MERNVLQRYLIAIGIIIFVGILIALFVIPALAVGGITGFKDMISQPFDSLSLAFTPEYEVQYGNWVKMFWIIYVIVVLCIWYSSRNKREYDEIEHGSSDWAKYGEQYKELSKTTGFVLAEKNYLPVNRRGNLNILVAGGSGSGKSAAFVIPTATQLLGSYVFTDPKGELYDRTAGYFKKNGYKIQTLNLVKPEFSDAYNPLLHIRNEIDVDIIANTIVKGQSKDTKGSDPFWEDMAEILLKALIYYLLAVRPKEEQSLASCANLVRAANNGGGESLLNKLMAELPANHPARVNYQSIEIASDKTFGSILSTLQSKLGKFDSKEIQGVTSSNTIDFEALGREKTVLYVIPPDSHSAYNFLLTIFFAQMIQQLYDFADTNGGKLDQLVVFMLDEFANIGKIPDFEKKISTSRSRNISFSVIIQTIDQLVDLYGDAAETIMANCDTHLFLGGNSLKTAEHFSKALGEKTIIRDSVSVSRDKDHIKSGESVSDQIMARPLMTADEIRRLNPDFALILVKGIKPVKAKKYYYFIKPISKELKACEVSHNDMQHVVRDEYRIYNPLMKEEDSISKSFNQPKTAPNIVFEDEPQPKHTQPKQEFSINIDEDEEDDMPQIISSNGKKAKKNNDYNYDIQKELEIKFDELFGSADEEE